MSEVERHIIPLDELPEDFPTTEYSVEFWSWLGRCVASFGMLEETLRMAILLLSATIPYRKEEIETKYEKWHPRIENNKSETLRPLVDQYFKFLKEHPETNVENLDEFECDLRELIPLRNALSHAAWPRPNGKAPIVPHFVDRQGNPFDIEIDVEWLKNLQFKIGRMIATIMNTGLHMGYTFPGLPNSPGRDPFAS